MYPVTSCSASCFLPQGFNPHRQWVSMDLFDGVKTSHRNPISIAAGAWWASMRYSFSYTRRWSCSRCNARARRRAAAAGRPPGRDGRRCGRRRGGAVLAVAAAAPCRRPVTGRAPLPRRAVVCFGEGGRSPRDRRSRERSGADRPCRLPAQVWWPHRLVRSFFYRWLFFDGTGTSQGVCLGFRWTSMGKSMGPRRWK